MALDEFLAELTWPPFILGALAGIPSAILYFEEVLLLIRNWRKFNSSFYLLFIVRAILNLSNLVTSYVGQRFGKLGLFMGVYSAMPRLLLCFFYFVPYYFFHTENLANLFMLLNRLHCIVQPFSYSRKWKVLTPFAILITLALPLTITIQCFFVNMFLHMDPDGNGFTLNYTYFDGYKNWMPIVWRWGNNYLAMCSALGFLCSCVLINSSTALLLHRRRPREMSQMSSEQLTSEGSAERRLTLYALVSFMGQLLMAAYYIYFYWVASVAKAYLSPVATRMLYTSAINNYPWVNDLATVALPACLMLWASERMRLLVCRDAQWLITVARTGKRPDSTLTPVTRLISQYQNSHQAPAFRAIGSPNKIGGGGTRIGAVTGRAGDEQPRTRRTSSAGAKLVPGGGGMWAHKV